MPVRLAAACTLTAALLAPAPASATDPLLCVDAREVYVRDFTYDPPMVCAL